jgi:antitoxin PrlF
MASGEEAVMSTKHAARGARVIGRAQVRKNSQITLPAEVRRALHIEEGDEVEFRVSDTGEVVLRGLTVVPADQRWFWSEQWQAGEREASEQIARGEVTTHGDVDEMFGDLQD